MIFDYALAGRIAEAKSVKCGLDPPKVTSSGCRNKELAAAIARIAPRKSDMKSRYEIAV
jgi:hypothetical protein